MAELSLSTPISRRRALSLGGGIAAAGGALTSLGPLAGVALGHDRPRDHDHHGEHHGDHRPQDDTLPADEIQEIVEAAGTVTKGVLSIDIERQDIGDVAGPLGVTFTPAFQVDGTLTFQPLGRHYIETVPNVWFIHFRGEGDPLSLARSVHDVLTATSTPLPQTMPASPTTPLDPDKLAAILHGDAQVGDEGVVTVTVDRTDTIVIDGIRVSPEANISSNIQFKPLASSGSMAAVGPDFSMTSSEVMPVVTVMRRQGWFQGCLYNQETNEYPQLYFAHMLKVGDAEALAHEIRRGLDLTDAS